MKLASPFEVIKVIKITKADFYRTGFKLKKYTIILAIGMLSALKSLDHS